MAARERQLRHGPGSAARLWALACMVRLVSSWRRGRAELPKPRAPAPCAPGCPLWRLAAAYTQISTDRAWATVRPQLSAPQCSYSRAALEPLSPRRATRIWSAPYLHLICTQAASCPTAKAPTLLEERSSGVSSNRSSLSITAQTESSMTMETTPSEASISSSRRAPTKSWQFGVQQHGQSALVLAPQL